MTHASPNHTSTPSSVPISRILTCCIIATVATLFLVAGGTVALAFDAWLSALMLFPLLVMAAMTGLAITYFPARAAEKSGKTLFADSPWPAGFRLILSLMLGLGTLSLITLALGSAGILSRESAALAFIPTTLLGIFGVRQLARHGFGFTSKTTSRAAWFSLLAALPIAVMLIMAAFPPGLAWTSEGNGYDVLEYHLELPKEYAAAQSTAPVAHNIYSHMPSLMEMLYTTLAPGAGPRGGSLATFIYGAQYLHLIMTCLAGFAILLAPLKLNSLGRIAGCILILATPWTIVVGTLAYNDGAMLTFGALALILALADDFKYRGVLIGLLLGFALGCKLTAGVLIAVPIGLILLCRLEWRPLIIAILLSALAFAPWAIRAHAATGNPVFPVAMKTFGAGYLTPELRDQFDRGHAPRPDQQSLDGRLSALLSQSLFDSQWSPNLASLQTLGGAPATLTPLAKLGFVWPLLIALLVVATRFRESRWLWLTLIVQLLAWLFLTHLQARFLLPILLPLSLMTALSCRERFGGILALLIITVQATGTLLLPYREVGLFAGVADPQNPRPYFLGSAASQPETLALPDLYLDKDAPTLDPAGRVYLVGLSTPLLFNHPTMYATAFDHNLLAEALATGGPDAAIRFLRDNKIQYVVVSWSEIDRLRRTYGYPAAITRETFERLTRLGLRQLPTRTPSIEIYEVTPDTNSR